MIYTVIGITDIDEIQDKKVFGYFFDFEEANEEVVNNYNDIWESYYKYVVVEKIEPGFHSFREDEWWYEYNAETKHYELIEKPKKLKIISNLSMG